MISRRYRIFGFLCFLSLLFVMGCGGDDVSQQDVRKGSIAGIVTLQGEQDFSGVEVAVGTDSAITDDEGAYRIEEISPGTVEVTASMEGYVSQTQEVSVEADAVVTVDFDLNFDNRSPVIESMVIAPEVLLPGENASVVVEAHDPDGSTLTYSFEVTEGFEVEATDVGGEATLTAPDEFGVVGEVIVTVEDAMGESVSETRSVETRTNEDPVITSVTATPSDWIESGGIADLAVDATDSDGDALDYNWSAPSGWNIVGDGEDVELQAPSGSRVEATISVTVDDGWGGTDTATIDVRTQDTEPDAFAFDDRSDVSPFSEVVSNSVIVENFDGALAADCSDCELSINGGAFATTVNGVESGDSVRIRTVAGPTLETVTAHVTVGDTQSQTWTVVSAAWTGERLFGTCTQDGRTGPSQGQCDGAYDSTTLDGEVTLNDGVQLWTVPGDGIYEFEVAGAEGGDSTFLSPGLGNTVVVQYELNAGDVLSIMVGHKGVTGGDLQGGGGGGGTFVVRTDDYTTATEADIIAIAGGGGGGGRNDDAPEKDGQPGTCGGDGGHHVGSGGCDGLGGTIEIAQDAGSGGGGVFGDGEAPSFRDSEGGLAFVNGGIGGLDLTSKHGGFGGGGGGSSECGFGGGGGGYSGGGGAEWASACGGTGGGGGSFLSSAGTGQNTSAGLQSGDGYVSITLP